MKNKFQSNGIRCLREALRSVYCLGLPREWKVIASIMILLTMGIGQVWGADLEIPLTNLSKFPLDYGLVTITNTENTTISSNQLQVNSKTAKFKVSTKVSNFYIKTISFTDANSSKNGGFTCDEGSYMSGPTENVFTYTAPNTTTTEANFTLVGSGGTAKMGTIVITLSTSDQVERLTSFGSISASKIPFTSSAATTNVEFSIPTSNGVSTGSSRISIGSGGKHLVVTGKNDKRIKYVAIPKYQQAETALTCSSNPAGTMTNGVWAPTTAPVESVDLTLTVSSTVNTQEIYVVYIDAPTYTVTYKSGLGTGADVVVENATKVGGCPNTFVAPAEKQFAGWKDALNNDVAVGSSLTGDITLTAQWEDAYDIDAPTVDDGYERMVWSNFANWGTTPPTNSGLNPANTYTITDGHQTLANVQASGCKYMDGSNKPTSTGITGYEKWFRTGSNGNYVQFTPVSTFDKGGKIRILISSNDATGAVLGTLSVGETKLGDILSYDNASTCQWQEFDIPTELTGTLTFQAKRTAITMFVWGVDIWKKICTDVSAPTGLSCTAHTENSLTFGWTAAEHASAYIVKLWDNATCTGDPVASDANVTTTSKTFGSLSASTTYYCKVQSKGDGSTYCAEGGITDAVSGETDGSSCAAAVPGNISKGSASGGTGTITLTAAGEAVSGDTWYWQDAEDGTATDKGSGATKNVSAAGTYYIRSYNTAGTCWSAAKSVTVEAADLLTPITPSLSYANSTLVLTALTTATPTLTGNAGSGSVTYALTDVTPAGCMEIVEGTGVVTAVAVGTAKVTATIAASGNYAGGNAVSGTIKVVAAPAGMIDQKLATGNVAWDASVIVTEDYTNVSGLTALSQHGSATASGNGNTSNGGQTSKIGTATGDFNDANYLELSFTVASGKEFEITSVAIPVQPVSSNTNNFKAVLSDNQGSTDIEGTKTNITNGNQATIDFSSYGTLKGTITLRIYAWGWGDGYRLGKNIVIDGTIKDEGACTAPTISWDGDQPSSALAGEGAKTFKVSSNYGDGVTLELSNNTCGATIAPIAGKDNKEWSLSYSTAGSVKVTAKVVGDGSTVCAETVTDATVKTFTVLASHTVTYNMKDHGASIASKLVAAGAVMSAPSEPTEIGYVFGGWYKEDGLENAWDFANDLVNDDVELFAKWTEFTGCTELRPATSGDAPTAANEEIDLQSGSKGGSIFTVSAKNNKFNESFEYTTHGFGLKKGADDVIGVTLNNEIAEGTKISVTLYSNNDGERGLVLQTATGGKVGSSGVTLGWADATIGDVKTFTYTAEAGDGLVGTNGFRLKRNNTVFLQCARVESCGDAIIYHDLTSAVDPAGKGTVTLGASSVREGLTTTAEYSAIDEAYEFDEWQISGTGASITDASANPATITMGTENAVVTLKLKAATPKHTVTYNVMGHGVAPADEEVKEGAKVTKPSDPSATGWAFCGWYKENTLENAWDFAVDVMGDDDMMLFAKWEDETSAIKLFDGEGNLNTTNFVTPAKTTIEISEVEYPTLVAFGSNRTSLAQAKQADLVMYSASTDATKIKFELYNANGSAKSAYLWLVEEGDDAATAIDVVEVPGNERKTTAYYTFNGTKNRSFYLTSGSKADIKVMQVTVLDNGTAIPQFGKAGYSVDFNKGRLAVGASATVSFEGASIHSNDEYAVLNNTSLKPKTYIQFNNAVANTTVKITKASSNAYYVTNDLEHKGTSYTTDQEVVLTTTGTWYIGSVNSGSVAALSKIEFVAPKCAEPTITPMTNVDFCEGDAFTPITVTATVSDGGTRHYQWYKEAGADDEEVGTDNASFTPDADGDYYVVVTNQKDGFSDNSATSNTITVKHFASAVITSAPLNQRGLKDAEATLTVVATGKNLSYKWYTCDNEAGEHPVEITPAETNASLTVTITEGMNQWYKVVVSSDCGDASATAKVEQFVPATPQNVTTSILWDWTSDAWTGTANISFANQTDEQLLADVDAAVPNNAEFHSDMLYGIGQYVWRPSNKFFQGTQVRFNNTVAGLVRVHFRSTNSGKNVQVAINGTVAGSGDAWQWTSGVEVAAGGVTIACTGLTGNETGLTRIDKIEFLELTDRRAESWIKPGELGTVCLKDDAIAIGADVYELAGCNENGYMAFDQLDEGDHMVAGKPYLFQATATGQISFYKTVGADHTETAESTKGMYGTFENVTFTPNTLESENIYYFSGQHIWKIDDFSVAITIPAYRCYVDYAILKANPADPNAAPGRRRVILGVNGQNTATGVDELNASETPVKVMIDGQLYILRGEKMYDATGRLVK